MAPLPSTISFKRLSEMPRRRAALTCLTPSGFRYSSSRISPGATAGPSQSGFLVIVFDADFVGMSILPSETQSLSAYLRIIRVLNEVSNESAARGREKDDIAHLQLESQNPHLTSPVK